MRKGWFEIPGVQTGDRTIAEQMIGLDIALAEAGGARVLDLGCAEGLITREFVRRGALRALGVEIVADNAIEASYQCGGLPIDIVTADVGDWLQFRAGWPGDDADITLALAILHKLKNPTAAARVIARRTSRLAVVRLPPATPGFVLDARSGNVVHDITAAFAAEGLRLAEVCTGPRNEWMGHYRRA